MEKIDIALVAKQRVVEMEGRKKGRKKGRKEERKKGRKEGGTRVHACVLHQ